MVVGGIGAGQDQQTVGPLPIAESAATPSPSTGVQQNISPGESAAALVSRGESAYSEGKYTEALSIFEAVIERAPDQPIPRYDAAAALFQLQRFEDARQRYQEAH